MNRFTSRATQVLALSRREAHRFGHRYMGTEHLLIGLIRLRQGVACQILAEFGFDLAGTRADLIGRVGLGPEASKATKVSYDASVKKTIALAAKEAKILGQTVVDAEHILLGLLKDRDCNASKMLGSHGIEIESIRARTIERLSSGSVPSGYSSLSKSVVDFRRLPLSVMVSSLLVLWRGRSLSRRN